jgi:molybdopterin molybdotransferase
VNISMTALDVATSCCADHSGFVSVEAAREQALAGVVPISRGELIPLHSAHGRIAASAVSASHALPPFNQSAMDGYAVRTRDFADGRATFPVVGRQAAGPQLRDQLPNIPAALRIFTGAPLPADFDAVIMQEHCTRVGDSVTVPKQPTHGDHIRLLGEDVPTGATILQTGTAIDARHIAILAAAGNPAVHVYKRVRVGVLSTGNELREPHEPLAPGEIHDCNRAMLLSLLQGPAVELTDLGRVHDDPATIAEAFHEASSKFDVILSTGGVSVGEEDHVRSSVAAAGGTLASLKASIKPGKPVSVGRLGGANLIGLPGNPVSALVTFLWFARPIVMRKAGIVLDEPRPVPAIAGFDETRHPGRDEFVPVVISGRDGSGRLVIEKTGPGGSARLSSLLGTDGLARIPGTTTRVTRGCPLDLYLFDGLFKL